MFSEESLTCPCLPCPNSRFGRRRWRTRPYRRTPGRRSRSGKARGGIVRRSSRVARGRSGDRARYLQEKTVVAAHLGSIENLRHCGEQGRLLRAGHVISSARSTSKRERCPLSPLTTSRRGPRWPAARPFPDGPPATAPQSAPGSGLPPSRPPTRRIFRRTSRRSSQRSRWSPTRCSGTSSCCSSRRS